MTQNSDCRKGSSVSSIMIYENPEWFTYSIHATTKINYYFFAFSDCKRWISGISEIQNYVEIC